MIGVARQHRLKSLLLDKIGYVHALKGIVFDHGRDRGAMTGVGWGHGSHYERLTSAIVAWNSAFPSGP
jgi:hypothetical protein